MERADVTVDAVVVGSGAAGLTAALVAKKLRLDVLVVEKSPLYGGSTALSGGGLWVPNNHLMKAAGIYDSPELAETYLTAIIGDRVPLSRIRAFIAAAPEMVRFLADRCGIPFQIVPNSADYYDRPGAITNGRALEVRPFNGKLLGPHRRELRSQLELPGGVGMSIGEFLLLSKFRTTAAGKRQLLRFVGTAATHVVTRRERLGLGQALVGRLRYALLQAGVPLWLRAPLTNIVVEGGRVGEGSRVVGVEVERDGRRTVVAARRGVVLAAGGFARNQAMREQYLPKPTSAEWSSANPDDTGDAIRLGMELGAATDLMDDAWWGSAYVLPGQGAFFTVAERQLPGTLVVDATGRRFANEAMPYTDWGHAVYAHHAATGAGIPNYLILDQRARSRYMLGTAMPGRGLPKVFFESGVAVQADTIRGLAAQLGMDPAVLEATIERFNGFARGKRDQDFRRGETPFEHVYADPGTWPNPSLAPVDRPPFYAIKMVVGDLGTKGGLVTDERARVLDGEGRVIPGLYAAGNTSASVMGNVYAGAGATIGPAMTFGYLAALDMAGAPVPAGE
ncbi:MAG TPA: FAD-dependent oxidoreductase [Candidatus Binatia bacterium]|nr:FAD-dependent oxidoreductase [Candidatus Binatia bacterium]